MGKEIDNHIARLDLDSSGFLKGAEEVLKAIGKLETALEFKGAEKGVENLSSVMSKTLPSAFDNAAASAQRFAGGTESAMSQVANSVLQAGQSFGMTAQQAEAFALQVVTALGEVGNSVSTMFDGLEGAQGKVDAAASHIANTINGVSAASQTAVGAAATGIAAKIASIAKVTAVVAAAGVAITAAVLLASSKVRETIGKTVDGIHMTVSEKVRAIRDAVSGGIDTIRDIVHDKTTSIADKAEQILAKSVMAIGKICVEIADAVKPTLDGIKKALETAFPETSALVEKGIADIAAKIKNALTVIHDGITTAFDSAINAIKEKFQSIGDKIKEFAESISGHFKKSKKEAEELADGTKKLSEEMSSAGDSADELGKKLDKIFEPLATEAQNAADGAKNLGDALQNASDAAANTASGLTDAGDAAVNAGEGMQNAADGAANASDGLTNAGDAGENASEGMQNAADGAEKASEGLNKEDEAADNAKESTEQVGEAADKAGENMKDLGNDSEEASSKLKNIFEGLGKFGEALGHDLGELPFKLKEISNQSGLVGAALTLALTAGANKVKELVGEWRGAKDTMEETSAGATSGVKNIGDAVETVTGKFTALGAIAFGALERIGQKAVDTGIKLVKSLSVDQVKQGWGEYELKMNSVQTIMSGTGESMERVNAKLDELNAYADKTIYSFSDMTSNIGKFTNQGVGLDEAVAAIQGISNAAALAGANTQQASHSMYNFAQALSTGYVQNIDWKSIENAMMATTEFKEELIKTGLELGTLKKKGDQVVSTTKDNNGHISDAFSAAQRFRDSLSSQWLTNDVLVKTLQKFSDETTELGQRATHAAQDVKTASQLMDTLKESVGSGWARTFELIIGNFEDAKKFWTGVNNLISPILGYFEKFRNGLLEGWRALGGREELLGGLKEGFVNLIDLVKAAKEGFETFMPPITAERIKEITGNIADFVKQLTLSKTQLDRVKMIFGKLGEGAKTAKESIKGIVDTFKELVDKSGAMSQLKDTISGLFGQKDIFSKDGLISALSTMVDKLNAFVQSNVIGTIKAHIGEIAAVAANVVSLVNTVISGLGSIASAAGGLLGKIGETFAAHLDDILALVNGVITAVKGAIDVVATFISRTAETWSKWLPTVLGAALNFIGKIGNALAGIGEFLSKHAEGISKFVKAFIVLKTIFGGLIKGIGGLIKVVNVVKGLADIPKVLSKLSPVLGPLLNLFKPLVSAIGAFGAKLAALAAPLGIAAAGIVAVSAAILILNSIEKKHQEQLTKHAEELYGLTEQQKDFAKEVENTAESYRQQNKAREATVQNVDKEISYYQRLVGDLREVVDENGKVKKGKEELANYIIGELQNALGIEIELVDGQITGYKELNGTLDETIQKKRMLALINAGKEDYENAEYEHNTLVAKEAKATRDVKEAEDNLASEVDKLHEYVHQYNDLVGKDSPFYIDDPDNLEKIRYVASSGISGLDGISKELKDNILQTVTNIETLDTQINVGTAEVPSLKETQLNAHNAVIENAATINNYNKLKESLDGTPEEQEEAITNFGYNIIHADDAGNVTSSDLKSQRDRLHDSYDDLKLTYGEDSPELMAAKAALDIASAEYEKSLKKDLQNRQRKRQQRDLTKMLSEDKAAGKQNTSASVQDTEASLGEKILGSIFGTIGKGLDILDTLFPGLLPKAEASGVPEELGKTLTDGTAKSIEENGQVVADAGKSTTDTYVKGGKENSGAATELGASLPQNAADGAQGNTSALNGAGGAGVDAYNAGGASASPLAALMGALLPQNTASGAEGSAPLIGAAGIAGVLGYISGGESVSPMATILGALLTVLASEGAASMIPEMESAGSNAANGFINSVGGADKLTAAYNAGAALAKAFNNGLTDTLKIESPSRVTYQDGEFTIKGLLNALLDGLGAVERAGSFVGDAVISGIGSPQADLSLLLSDDYTDAMTITPVIDMSGIQNGAGQLRDMISSAADDGFGRMALPDIFRRSDADNDTPDDRALNELRGLRQDMARFNEQLGKMQVRLDSGVLVGEMEGPLDEALGRRAALRSRR